MITNRFETEGGAYHFALEDIVDFIDTYGLETVLDDVIKAYEHRCFVRRMEERKHMEFGAHYD